MARRRARCATLREDTSLKGHTTCIRDADRIVAWDPERRSLVFSAGPAAVRDVWVGGEPVVAGGTVITIDEAAAAARLGPAQARAAERVPSLDRAGRTLDEVSPFSLPKV
jgi:hypothetical protein